MRKNRFINCLLLISISAILLSGCSSINPSSQDNQSQNQNSLPQQTVNGVVVKGFIKNDDGKYNISVDNTIDSFDFKEYFLTKAEWTVAKDSFGKDTFYTKTAPLEIGDNEFYVIVNNKEYTTFDCIIRRLDMFTVSFNTNGAQSIPDQLVQEGSFATKPENDPVKAGYDFKGWDYDFSIPVTSNLRINATYEALEYTITFDVNGGNSLQETTQKIKYGQRISLPTPERTGYSFQGWYYGERLIEDRYWRINQDVTLTAHWEKNTYQIAFNEYSLLFEDGESNKYQLKYEKSRSEVIKQDLFLGNTYDLYVPTEKNDSDYDFVGWYTDSKCTIPFDLNKPITARETKLYSKWEYNYNDIVHPCDGNTHTYDFWTDNPSVYASNHANVFNIPAKGLYRVIIEPVFDYKIGENVEFSLFYYIPDKNVYTSRNEPLKDKLELELDTSISNFSVGIVSTQSGSNAKGKLHVSVTPLNKITPLFNKDNFILEVKYDEPFFLGEPQSVPDNKSFVGWFTQPSGEGTQLTNNKGYHCIIRHSI